ncbi:hypothetical protein DPMN_028993 [Dreissena polymorpha]|uniref:Uncharacterized protein n=1 Tax=Dreissena polymorpha TaxID=45954 RepID=A0A9D4LXB3_DREPO|nr:hypothetical protein DPMN_028993 [Dreissena polymorpha]
MFNNIKFWADIQLGYNLIFAVKLRPRMTNRALPKEKKKDSFAEKFATQVIKNLQVEVRNIHVRYEDKYTNPLQPFSIGVTLKEFLFRCPIPTGSHIHKLVKLEQLAVYWNSHSNLYEGKEKTEILVHSH